VRLGRAALWPLLLLGCSNITEGNGGVVALQVLVPAAPALEPGDTVTLQAQALDRQGNVVQAPITWLTADPTLVTIVDASTGLITTDSIAGIGRVQAQTGNLLSDVVSMILRAPSDSLAITGAASVDVLPGDTASPPLVAAVQSFNPAGGVFGTSISYVVVDSVANAGLVKFPGGGFSLRATTGIDGSPSAPVTLVRVSGAIQPPVVLVEVSAYRPSGIPVAGSGQQFTVNFQ
jgi:hypothetical protein